MNATPDGQKTPGTPGFGTKGRWGNCRTVDVYEKIEKIGEGTFGEVFKARDRQTSELVALKKIRMENEKNGFPITAIRELKILRSLRHENIVRLKEIVVSKETEFNKSKSHIYMVFEYIDHDLTGLLESPDIRFTEPQIKCYMRQLLKGLHFLHSNSILHRDLKTSNLLISNDGTLKLADFGLARTGNAAQLTNRVITIWYRPPELLLGANKYSSAIDMWSVGCIFAELMEGKPILRGENEVAQMSEIIKLCGTPSKDTTSVYSWPDFYKPGNKELPHMSIVAAKSVERTIHARFSHFSPSALDLLDKMLLLDPAKRLSAKDAYMHRYFFEDPLPADKKSLPQYKANCHEYTAKANRHQQRRQQQDQQPSGPTGARGPAPHTAPSSGAAPNGPNGPGPGGPWPYNQSRSSAPASRGDGSNHHPHPHGNQPHGTHSHSHGHSHSAGHPHGGGAHGHNQSGHRPAGSGPSSYGGGGAGGGGSGYGGPGEDPKRRRVMSGGHVPGHGQQPYGSSQPHDYHRKVPQERRD
eukprot:TRINITY_DN9605_c0_g1::TRINITY_DN9605_c0_g1_i1::g.12177::m.12177 TRINITY_DN9605_c0_g1::TRINITY_DN9605_c0_g1_i1::g.12177  ORF type:complete len:526 (+),score=36.08,sp/Q5JK68/CDKC2_ORYSJ/49.22/1e-137,Pkinase/PF00069.20/2e-74,Pkinase_Tyr/PF07714.12/4.2e-35,Kinase-like/PF14531.1/15,Kinase-like/PF14531.1/0.0011,APH/PF01636.18/0.0042,Kdo/PF06293.9/0.15 TRINITY_DN9605_c0_g1_i1:138-1715(+)